MRAGDSDAARPRVSVVMPVYNHAGYVAAAIQSVFGQTCRPLELIIIDDGSRDDSARVIGEFLKTPPPEGVSVRFTTRENRGAPASINEGIAAARGEYLAILNSDDIYEPQRLDVCVNALLRARARLAFTYVEPIDAAGAPLAFGHPWRGWYYEVMGREMDVAPSISYLLLTANLAVSTGNLVFHRSLAQEVGPFAEYRYAHDLDFILRTALVEEPILIRERLYRYRLHGSNTIAENHDRTVEETVDIVRRYFAACLAGSRRNPVAPDFPTWPANLNLEMHFGNEVVRKAVDRLVAAPAPRAEAAPADLERKAEIVPDASDLGGREITIVSHELSRTGAPMLVLELARALAAGGARPTIVALRDGELRTDFEASSIAVHALDGWRFVRVLSRIGHILQRAQRVPVVLARLFPQYARFIPGVPNWLAWILGHVGNGFLAAASALMRPRLSRAVHGPLLVNSFASHPLAVQLLSRHKGDAFWYIHETYDPQLALRSTVSRQQFDAIYATKRLRLLFGSDATRAVWKQHGFDGTTQYWSGIARGSVRAAASPSSNLERPVVLSAGTAGTRKGTRFLIEAFAHGRACGAIPPSAVLVIVGCGPPTLNPQVRDFMARCAQDDLRGSVQLLPTVPPDALDRHYEGASVFVQSSIMECLPLTLLKAMAHRLPIVSTDANGCREAILHEDTGLLVPQRQIAMMGEAIGELLTDREKAARLGAAAGRRFDAMFALEATLPRLVATVFGDAPDAKA